ncbi:hypothetical protein FISHEDRAFT_5441, partial [Fistulina hepatica ATCC 64428]
MRAKHSACDLPAFPVYCASFLSDNEFVLGGGGGASRSGIKNKLRLYTVDNARNINLKDEFELSVGEDVPMSMASDASSSTIVCGVNSTLEKLQDGRNENCRIFEVKDHMLSFSTSFSSHSPEDPEDFQKVTVLSPDATSVAVAFSHCLSFLSYPSLQSLALPIHTDKEIYDAIFTDTTLVVVTTESLLTYKLPASSSSPTLSKKKKGKQRAASNSALELLCTIELPKSVVKDSNAVFRAARYYNGTLYTVINTIPVRSRTKKSAPRQAYVCKWQNEGTGSKSNAWTVVKSRSLGEKGATCFDMSRDGKRLALGLSDYSITVLDADSLA